MTEYLVGLKEIWRNLFLRKQVPTWVVQNPQPTQSLQPVSSPVAEVDYEELYTKEKYRSQDLTDALRGSLKVLETWETVTKQMLNPHQHNTIADTKEAIRKIKRVL